MTKVIPVVLCGGSGTRLWPLSRSSFPKQFLTLPGGALRHSLFQETIKRVNQFDSLGIGLGSTLVVANEEHRFIVLDQLREFKNKEIFLLLESSGRNTAPALTIAALKSLENMGGDDDPILIVMPSDQKIVNDDIYIKAIRDCVALLDDEAKKTIVVLGVPPKSPDAGFGYIRRNSLAGMFGEYDVANFVEKPDAETASEYLKDGSYYWNSGIFVLRASTWLAALNKFRPDIYSATKTAWTSRSVDRVEGVEFIRPNESLFNKIPIESIDYAVIEKCCQNGVSTEFTTKVIELNSGWSDMGSWNAIWESGTQDSHGNVIGGDVLFSNSTNSLLHSSSRLLGVVGVDNLVVIETADSVLVIDKKRCQDVKAIVSQMASQRRVEKNLHRKVMRPWGWYDSLDEGECFKVKRIQVNPGASLSLQMHHHRAEHWIVVRGVAQVTNGNDVVILRDNQSIYIPRGQAHRLHNPNLSTPLEIIEVQTGAYLGEDDIVRFDDVYGRS